VFVGVMQMEDVFGLDPKYCWFESSHPHSK
jgi:hypothetical protein